MHPVLVCSFFIMLNGQGQPGKTLNSLPWWSQAELQHTGKWLFRKRELSKGPSIAIQDN